VRVRKGTYPPRPGSLGQSTSRARWRRCDGSVSVRCPRCGHSMLNRGMPNMAGRLLRKSEIDRIVTSSKELNEAMMQGYGYGPIAHG